jgi:hypothetical protein
MFKNYNVNVTETQNKAIEVGIIALHGFYLLWGLCFISEGGSFIISAAVTNWYFNKDYVCTSSVSRFMNYHSGSVAVGSFYIALFWFLKLVYEWIKVNIYEYLAQLRTGKLIMWENFKVFGLCLLPLRNIYFYDYEPRGVCLYQHFR